MKFSNELQEEIFNLLSEDKRFNYNGSTTTHFFCTWEKVDESEGNFIDLKKSHSEKTLAKVKVLLFTDRFENKEVEFKIEMYLNSYCEWETICEGWAENLDEFKTALKIVGL